MIFGHALEEKRKKGTHNGKNGHGWIRTGNVTNYHLPFGNVTVLFYIVNNLANWKLELKLWTVI